MAYRKRPLNSRKYIKSESHGHKSHSNHAAEEESSIMPIETENPPEKKTSRQFGFLSSLLGTGERAERSGSPLFNVFNYDIYLDDLLLIGLIILLMTDKIEDEILLIVLIYLLLDIF